MKLKSQDVLITGASGAIGNALTTRFASLGYTLHITSRTLSNLSQITRALRNNGQTVYTYRLELSSIQNCQKVVNAFFKNAKNPSVLICNAGNLGVVKRFREADFKNWQRSISENFLGQAAMIHAFALGFARRNLSRGTIITLSGAGLGSNTSFDRVSSYSTAKAASTHLVEALAPEMKELGITINAIAPGQVVSGITRQALAAGEKAGLYAKNARNCLKTGGVSPERAADLAEFLSSQAARAISGRLLSARFDYSMLKENPSLIANNPNLFRLRRIDGMLFSANAQ